MYPWEFFFFFPVHVAPAHLYKCVEWRVEIAASSSACCAVAFENSKQTVLAARAVCAAVFYVNSPATNPKNGDLCPHACHMNNLRCVKH
mmetsp:Transcript_13615/g.14852  ORF Transcript_13615/g.14852 Transcript_13615/m.14852 type:complete len:89 (-) Transcript_13615:882-1148(-)